MEIATNTCITFIQRRHCINVIQVFCVYWVFDIPLNVHCINKYNIKCHFDNTQRTQGIPPMPYSRWDSVVDDETALIEDWVYVCVCRVAKCSSGSICADKV